MPAPNPDQPGHPVEEHPHRTFEIIVNGQRKKWDEERISFEQLVHLAYPDAPSANMSDYTITYTKGPPPKPDGSLLPGQFVRVKDGMVFDVVPTVKS